MVQFWGITRGRDYMRRFGIWGVFLSICTSIVQLVVWTEGVPAPVRSRPTDTLDAVTVAH